MHREAVTDARGTFAFSAVPLGRYSVSGVSGPLSAVVDVDVTSSGESVNLVLKATKTIGRTSATVTSRAVVAQRAGTDVTLNTETIARSPAAGSTSGMLLQVPGAARGANGAVHVNGDHGDINYVIDGVALPQALNRVIGNEVDASNVGFAEVLEGAYPAQYGERFGAVLNLASRGGTPGPAGVTFDAAGGAFGRYEATLGYHAPVGRGGSLLVASRTGRDGRALDPPSPDAPHDAGSSANQFVRVTLPYGKSSFANFTLSHSLQTYQIPADVAAGAPAAQDDVERQDDVFASLQFRRAIGDRGTFSFGPSVKRSRIQDLPDQPNDFAAGFAAGAPADCSADVTTCALSLFSDRTSVDYRINADYDLRSAAHEVRAGIVYDVTTVAKRYAIALQPFNPFALAPFTVVDAAPNTGHLAEGYLQDSWRMGSRWRLDYGVRADVFGIASPEFASGFAQLSPRVKLTRTFGDNASVYVYYGRFFTPFSLENVSPSVARTIQPSSGNFDLRPQRDSDYEIGGHVAVGRGDLGVRVAQKNATDLIDDTQVGTTNLHQDINFAQGRIATQSLAYQRPLGAQRPPVRLARAHVRRGEELRDGAARAVFRRRLARLAARGPRGALGRERRAADQRPPQRLAVRERRVRQRPHHRAVRSLSGVRQPLLPARSAHRRRFERVQGAAAPHARRGEGDRARARRARAARAQPARRPLLHHVRERAGQPRRATALDRAELPAGALIRRLAAASPAARRG